MHEHHLPKNLQPATRATPGVPHTGLLACKSILVSHFRQP